MPKLTVIGRKQLARKVLDPGLTLKQLAAGFHVCAKTAAKWTKRFEQGGVEALRDRGPADALARPYPSS